MEELPKYIPIHILMPAFFGGGAETTMLRLAHYWISCGRQVVFVSNSEEGPLRNQLNRDVGVVELIGMTSTRRALPRLFSWMAGQRPRLLISVLYDANIAGSVAVKLTSPNTTHVALVRNHVTAEFSHVSGFRYGVRRFLLPRALRLADMIGCVSDSVARDVLRFAGLSSDTVRTTYNPIPKPDLCGEKSPVGWPPTQDAVFVAVGRLEPQKDYPTMLKALSIARREASASLVILGTGSQQDALEKMAIDLGVSEHVSFIGYRTDVINYMAQADACVLTSCFEGFPNVVAEAISLGKTVVATDAPGGTGEILGNGEFGYLAPVGDAAAIASQMLRALREPLDPMKLRARAHDFEVAAVAGRYEALFAEGLKRKELRSG